MPPLPTPLHRPSFGSTTQLPRRDSRVEMARDVEAAHTEARTLRDKPSTPSKSQAHRPQTQLNTLSGLLLLCLLVFLSYLSGTAFPNVPKSKPVPTQKRTICKQEAFRFDDANAKGLKVLVTGAASFLGSHVARYCAEELQMEVVGIDNLVKTQEKLQYAGDISIVNGDITDPGFLQKIFERYRFDVIYHLADFAGVTVSHAMPSYTYQNNIVGSANLVTEAVKNNVSKIVMQSSVAVYGNATLPWAESTHPLPIEPYGISKLAVEQHVGSMGAYYGLEYVILRLHSLYGPRQDTLHSNLIAQAIAASVSGENLKIVGDGTQKRQFTFVEDVVRSVVVSAFIQPSPQLVNLGSDEITTVNEVLEHIAEITGRPINVTYVDRARNHVHHVQAVHDKSQCLLQMLPYTSFKEGLRKTIDWALTTTTEFEKSDRHNLSAEIQGNASPTALLAET